MLLNDIIRIGEIFEIQLNDGCSRTKLQEIFEDGNFAVFQPTFRGLPIWAEHGQVFSFSFYRPDGIYIFSAEMKEAYLKDDLQLCRFRQVTPVRKKQRRQAYRLPVVLGIEIELLKHEQEDTPKAYKGKTVNISEKSVQLTCFTPMPENTAVSITIHFDETSSIILQAEVIRCTKPEKRREPYEIVLLFFDCTDRDIAYMRRYILQQQINAKAKKKV